MENDCVKIFFVIGSHLSVFLIDSLILDDSNNGCYGLPQMLVNLHSNDEGASNYGHSWQYLKRSC